jgi:hypothetical protein
MPAKGSDPLGNHQQEKPRKLLNKSLFGLESLASHLRSRVLRPILLRRDPYLPLNLKKAFMSFALLSGPADPQPVSGTQGMPAYGGGRMFRHANSSWKVSPILTPWKSLMGRGALKASNFPRSVIRLKLFWIAKLNPAIL